MHTPDASPPSGWPPLPLVAVLSCLLFTGCFVHETEFKAVSKQKDALTQEVANLNNEIAALKKADADKTATMQGILADLNSTLLFSG